MAGPDWGVLPVLFRLGATEITAYGVATTLALLAGAVAYWWEARRQGAPGERSFWLLFAAVAGGVIGAKAPIWAMNWGALSASGDTAAWLGGRTIVGGLLGGALAVIITRRALGITTRSGNLFAAPLALSIAIGRLGCFLGGCCYGVPTGAAWGVDFGDGVLRHPTQLYESVAAFALFAWLQTGRAAAAPGALFRRFMLGYFAVRFLVEFVRVEPRPYWGLTLAQVVALGIVAYYVFAWRAGPQEEVSDG